MSSKHGQPWTAEEDAYLRERYAAPPPDTRAIADHLGRTRGAVMQRASELRLTQPRPPSEPWSAREIALLRRGYGVLPTDVLAKALGRTPSAVRRRADMENIGFMEQRADALLAAQRTAARLRLLLAACLNLAPVNDVAARLGVTPEQVRRLALREAAAATDAAGRGLSATERRENPRRRVRALVGR